ncbi:S1 family peptidase [Symbioplanes lichenis]|uniref:S1 family peptidase n=1 Tax=Symbioplanes lichenis TaxID=1629072 RepID=UPI0027396E71|nr:trypsin-like serine protease [Actinoplanes lichenis]
MSKFRKVAGAALGSALLGSACVVATATPAGAIVGGFAGSKRGKSLAPAVVRLAAKDGWRDPGVNCTGTLIADRWVVTAQHCTNKGEKQGRPYRASKITVYVNTSARNAAQSRTASEVWRLDGYDERSGVGDIALLKLSKPVAGVTPVRIGAAPIPAGTNAYVYGFGETADGRGDRQSLPRVAEVKVASPRSLQAPCRLPGQVTYVTSVNGGTARGDSGGPTLEWSAGVPTLFAVTGGSFDRTTCRGGKVSATWVGLYNRVDRRSAAWHFLRAHVGGL